MTCPLEKKLAALLRSNGIWFTRPERDKTDPTTLDFFLPELRLYIEVKQFYTDRIAGQLQKVPQGMTAIVLIGPRAVEDFMALCNVLGTGSSDGRAGRS